MSACEICWAEASRKAFMLGGSTAEHYHAELDAHPEHTTGSRAKPVVEKPANAMEAALKRAAEAEADRDDLEARLAALLWNLTDGRMSGTDYDVQTMVSVVEEAFERAQQADVDAAPRGPNNDMKGQGTMSDNELVTAEEAKAAPDGQWVQDAAGQAYCLIDTHMGFPQRMAMYKRSLTNLDNLTYPLHLCDFVGDCEHKWGTYELGHCYRCGQVVAEPRPLFFEDGGEVFRMAAEHNARVDAARALATPETKEQER